MIHRSIEWESQSWCSCQRHLAKLKSYFQCLQKMLFQVDYYCNIIYGYFWILFILFQPILVNFENISKMLCLNWNIVHIFTIFQMNIVILITLHQNNSKMYNNSEKFRIFILKCIFFYYRSLFFPQNQYISFQSFTQILINLNCPPYLTWHQMSNRFWRIIFSSTEDANAAIVNKSVEIMSIDTKSCLFCLKVTNDGIEIFGQIGKTLNVWEIIVKYFWFDVI